MYHRIDSINSNIEFRSNFLILIQDWTNFSIPTRNFGPLFPSDMCTRKKNIFFFFCKNGRKKTVFFSRKNQCGIHSTFFFFFFERYTFFCYCIAFFPKGLKKKKKTFHEKKIWTNTFFGNKISFGFSLFVRYIILWMRMPTTLKKKSILYYLVSSMVRSFLVMFTYW